MGHQISQFDIPDRQLLAINAQPKVGTRTDIGEAKIIRTIFGNAQVRVIRKQDKKRRAWLLMALAVMAVAAAALQGWLALQQNELLEAPRLPLSERIRVSAPVFQPEDTVLPVVPSSARKKSRTPTEMVIDSMTTRREPPPQQPIGLKPNRQMTAKPITAKLAIASKPQAASLAANNNSSQNQVDMQQPFKMSDPIQSVAPAVAIPPATQPAANRPAVAAPLFNENTSPQSSSVDNPPQGSGNAQP